MAPKNFDDPDSDKVSGRWPASGIGARPDRSRITLLQLLILAFGALILVGLVSVLVLSGLANYRNTFKLLNERTVLMMADLEDDLAVSLGPTEWVLDATTRFYADGRFDTEPSAGRTTMFEAVLAGAPHVDALLVYRLGSPPQGVARDPDGRVAPYRGKLALPPSLHGFLERMKPGDPPIWGAPVFNEGSTYINVVAPLVRDGRLEGALVLAIDTDHLADLVSRVVGDSDAVAFVLYGEEGLLALSQPEALFRNEDPRSAERSFIPLEKSADPVLSRFSERRPLMGFEAAARAGVSVDVLEAEGVRYSVMSGEVTGFGPKPWTIGVYMPLSDFGDVVELLAKSIAVGIGIIVLALLATVLVGRLIARVMGRTAAAAHAIAELRFEESQPLPPSRIHEIDTAARAFNAMREAVLSFARYVPRPLVERLMREGDAAGRSRHRLATVMFTDIVGFTSLSEHMPADDVVRLLDQHFGTVVDAVNAEGGLVDKYLGDGVMAFWLGHDGDGKAGVAVDAARAIARRVKAECAAARARGEAPMRVRIGLHTGEVIAGNVGPPDRVNFTIVGDTVNVASRLESLGHEAAPEADCVILASETTVAGIDPAIPRSRIGSVTLRNRSQPLDVWRIRSRTLADVDATPASAAAG